MEDRVVQNPHRYQLAPVSGQSGVYDLAPIPGKITTAGTPLNKATLFSDSTAALFGLSGANATPDKGFQAVNTKINQVNTNLTGSINSVSGRATVLEGTAWKKMGTISLPAAAPSAEITVPAGTSEMIITAAGCTSSINHTLTLTFNDLKSINAYSYTAAVSTSIHEVPVLLTKYTNTLFEGLTVSCPSTQIYLYNLNTAFAAALATFLRADRNVVAAGQIGNNRIAAVNKITINKSDIKNVAYTFNVWRR